MAENWVKVATSGQVLDGEMLGVIAGKEQVALYNVDGEICATSNICTHGFALLTDGFLEDNIIECPLHAGRFDVCTGAALGAPVTEDIRTFPVKQSGDDILVDIGAP